MQSSKGTKVFILISDCQLVGVWSNLKKLCDEMKTKSNGKFTSYSKLSKMRTGKDGKPVSSMQFKSKDEKEYFLFIAIVK